MKASHLEELALHHMQRQLPLMVLSSPGLGKTSIVRKCAAQLGMRCIIMHGVTLDPTDVKGLPFAEVTPEGDRVVAWHRQPWLTIKEPFVLFLDEFSQAPVSVKNALAPLILEQEIDGIRLPAGSAVIAAGNRKSDKAGTTDIPSHIPNRVTVVTQEFSVDDWKQWAIDEGLPMEMVAWANFQPGSINDFDPARMVNATPRQWEVVARHFQDIPKHLRMDFVAGRVGEGHAGAFEAFIRVCDELPNPDLCLLDPENAPVPTGAAAQWAISGAMSHKASANTFDAVTKYMSRLPAEFGVMAIKDALRRDKSLAKSPAFSKWAVKNQAVLI